jgi:uracil-DNA glycosylase family 4
VSSGQAVGGRSTDTEGRAAIRGSTVTVGRAAAEGRREITGRNPSCTACALHVAAHTVCLAGVPRVWRPQAAVGPPLMVVGENPGRAEDLAGQPWVGAAGDLLDRTLTAVGIGAGFVTNATRCTKGPAGTPLPRTALTACAPYLDAEIAAERPAFILALGGPAFHRLGGKGKISEQAGKEFWAARYGCWVLPALHPAAVLRTPGLLAGWQADLARFAALVARGGPPPLPPLDVRLVDDTRTLRELAFAIERGGPLSYDFEATPLPWWHKDWIPHTVAFYLADADAAYVLPLAHPGSPWRGEDADLLAVFFARIRAAMTDPARERTNWNALYDDPAWQRVTGYYPHVTCDAMALAHLVNEAEPKSLKWQGRSKLGWPDWDIDARQAHPLAELAHYNAYDAYAAHLLRAQLTTELASDDAHGAQLARYFEELVMPSIRAVGRMMARGIYVDPATLEARRQACATAIAVARAAVPVANPGSRNQVAAWLYEQEGLPVTRRTLSGLPATDEATINMLARDFPAAKRVLEYRKWTKHESTYLAPAAAMLQQATDQRAHFDYRSTSVETGRYGSRFHTQPRDPFVRSIFSAPAGWTLISADFAQLEARLAAWLAAGKPATWEEVDPRRAAMLLAFREGRDIYIETAASVLGKRPEDVTTDKHDPKNERQVSGKVPTLAMIYQISVEGFRQYAWSEFEVDYSEREAEHIHRAFYQRWPELAAWHQDAAELVQLRGWAQNPLGRVRHLPEAQGEERALTAAACRAGINAPVQGAATNLNDAAHVYLDRYFATLPEPRPFHVGIVHDAQLVECPDPLVAATSAALRLVMTETVPRLLRPLGLRLPDGLLECEITTGPWGGAL